MKRLLLFLLPILLFGCSEELIIGNDIPESTDKFSLVVVETESMMS